jgi:hypothetical protein
MVFQRTEVEEPEEEDSRAGKAITPSKTPLFLYLFV